MRDTPQHQSRQPARTSTTQDDEVYAVRLRRRHDDLRGVADLTKDLDLGDTLIPNDKLH